MPRKMVEKKEGLREGAIRWLDNEFSKAGVDTFSQRYMDARKYVVMISNVRSRLVYLSGLSRKRRDVQEAFNEYFPKYQSAILDMVDGMKDAVSRMEKLRPRFAKTEHASQLKDYDAQIGKLKSAISEYERDLEYVETLLPREIKRQEFKRIDDVLNTEIAALDVHARPVWIAKGRRRPRPKLKRAHASAKPEKPGAEYDMVFTLKDVEEAQKSKMSVSPEKPPEIKMVFTEKEVEELEKKTGHAATQAGKKERLNALKTARKFEMRIIGPNCIGIFDGDTRIDTFFQSRERMLRPLNGTY